MFRARHPLTVLLCILGILITALATTLYIGARPHPEIREYWRTDAQYLQNLRIFQWVLGAITVPSFLFLAISLIRVSFGYEPSWMQSTILGATVIDAFPNAKSGGSVELLDGDGNSERYVCDAAEYAGLKVGDFGHFRVIGGQLASYRLLPNTDPPNRLTETLMEDSVRRKRRLESYGDTFWVRIAVVVGPILSGVFLGHSFFPLVFGEVVGTTGRRYHRTDVLQTHESARMYGFLMLGVGIAIAAFCLYILIRGADDTIFETDERTWY